MEERESWEVLYKE